MIVIYTEKASLAKAIAAALHAGNRIAHPKEPTIGHYEFTFKGEKAVLCHGISHHFIFGLPSFVVFIVFLLLHRHIFVQILNHKLIIPL